MLKRHPYLSWLAIYSALTVVVTWPLILKLGSSIAGDRVDPLLLTSILWWNAHVLPLTERWWNGFAFFPMKGMLAFSDHLLGESLIATPLQWLGCSPALAFNLTLLATFPLCAIAAHWLGFVLTRRHDAAAICGLAYGFNPYRIPHVAHLQLCAAFGMPAALAALHMAMRERRSRWIAVLAAALILQGLCTAYYIPFFGVLLLLWVLWFVRWNDRWLLMSIVGAGACMLITLMPLAIQYARIHSVYGMSRDMTEIQTFSADITSLVTAGQASALWGWTSALNGGEGQIFPGLFVTLLVGGAILAAPRTLWIRRDAFDILSSGLLVLASVNLLIAASTWFLGPRKLQLGPIAIGGGAVFKPLSVALATAMLALAASSRVRDAWRQKSAFAFYVCATGVLFLCTFGPKPTFLGTQVLYQPPYAWLMHLPVFADEIRAPARFAMLAVLTLAAAGALAFDRLRLPSPSRSMLAAAIMIGIAGDGLSRGLPVPSLPDVWPPARAAGFDAVVELPYGLRDPEAMYRATIHHRPIVNGYSGYTPSMHPVITGAVRDEDASVLDALVAIGHLLVVVDDRVDPHGFWKTALIEHPGSTQLGSDGQWSFFTVKPPSKVERCESRPLALVRAFDETGDIAVTSLNDGSPDTFWRRLEQRAGEGFTIDLGEPATPCAVSLSLGRAAWAFPRKLVIDTSLDGRQWTLVFEGSTSRETLRGALARPIDAWLDFPMAAGRARYVRFRLGASRPDLPWQVSDVVVRGDYFR